MELIDVSYQYNKSNRQLLNQLDLKLKRDQLNVVLGLNGAGKTTLFNIMSGSFKPTSGTIKEAVSQDQIAYQVQGVPFLNQLKGKDLVRLFLRTASQPFDPQNTKFSEEMTERERLLAERLWELPLGQMSLGERRWLMVMAMCELNRKLYIFDEPTSGVDPDSRLNVLHKLESVALDSNRYVVMSTHTLQELEHVNCNIFLLHNGSVAFAGSYEELTETNKNPDEAFRQIVSL
ncbi:ATP-binding cassette domain-containing protein [Alkalibacillus haloalkaliphilus]|uniref:ATP-binding cassette domain-containing protein n=1 Tax=Alkalibacillus haloalkaliphilus TaxID=94136 RepID=UPI0029356DC6|nr:ATP-binding cassette domain-containing protein [Alkalibacillus haloalkaliphilus]MDV2582617.1 ATP-binding cassette domain-containing protein [Alkalibacillus haloalkaliphilus]